MPSTEPRFTLDEIGPYVVDRTLPKRFPGSQRIYLGDQGKADRMLRILNDLEELKEGGHSPGSLRVLEDIVRESREEHHRREPLAYAATREEEEALAHQD